jgi:penicillin-binding protein 2
MKSRLLIVLALFVIAACSQGSSPTPTAGPTRTPTLPPPDLNTTSAPDATHAAQAYLDAWKAEDYATMYGLLSPLSREAISAEDFEAYYRSIAAEAALESVEYEVLSALTEPKRAQVNYRVNLNSVLVGEIARDTLMNLILEEEGWRVQWDETLIIPELEGGNLLSMDVRVPSRGNIYDRNGHALVAQADAVALGLDTSQVNPEQQGSLLNTLWDLTGIRPDALAPILDSYRQFGWYLPVGEAPADLVQPLDSVLTSFAGMVMQAYRSRFYFDGGIAPQTIGYVSAIQEEEVETYKRRGYRIDEKVGRSGLEAWGEEFLSGQRGGALYVVGTDGSIITKLAETEPQPSYSIFTTLDRDLQTQTEDALSGFTGAVVVLERDTGRVLAIASSPGFDPNLFEPTNFNQGYLLGEIFNNPDTPLLNRATQGQYPLGSVFKIITMSAALENGLYDLEQTYECGHAFSELPGFVSYDWTYEKELPASGTLTLQEGLMRSCNPFFQHIALALYNQNLRDAISKLAEGFGLGSESGMEGVAEEEGQIPVPENEIEAVNQAIGQGPMLVTPLQVAQFIAAIGNGGTIHQPQIIERIESPAGEILQEFEPSEAGELPVSEETLAAVQEAMDMVVNDTRGTAYRRFVNFPIPVAGKTGTAETGGGRDPHAWFAGYTYAEQEGKPDLAIVVLAENIGEGSDYAAPIFKRILEIYYYGNPRTPYWWESSIGVTKTPTPEFSETPAPEGTPTP